MYGNVEIGPIDEARRCSKLPKQVRAMVFESGEWVGKVKRCFVEVDHCDVVKFRSGVASLFEGVNCMTDFVGSWVYQDKGPELGHTRSVGANSGVDTT